jgi:hypothetical protein
MAAMPAAQGPAQFTTCLVASGPALVSTPCNPLPISQQAGNHRVLAQFRPVIGRPCHQSVHGAVRIDKAVRRTETSAHNVIAAHLRKPAADFISIDQSRGLKAHGDLRFVVRAQVGQVPFRGSAEEISLRTVIAWIAEPFLEAGIKRYRVHRHLNIDRSRELGAHATHALAGRSFALSGFPFDDQNAAAARRRQVVRNA